MERADAHRPSRRLSRRLFQALAQLVRGVSREGDGGNLPWFGACFQQAEDTGRQSVGFACSGPGYDGQSGALAANSRLLGRVEPGGSLPRRRFLFRGRNRRFWEDRGFAGRRRRDAAKPADLAAVSLAFLRRQQLQLAINAVVARSPAGLTCPKAAQPFFHPLACHPAHVGQGRLTQNVKLRPQLAQQQPVYSVRSGAGRPQAGGSGDHFGQRGQPLKGGGVRRLEAGHPVGQLERPVLHAYRQLFAADRADSAQSLRLLGRKARPAIPAAVPMVFALFGEKLHGAPPTGFPPPANGLDQRRIGIGDLQQIGLPPQLGRGVGVGIGQEGQPVQSGNPPVHGRVGGKTGFQGPDLGRQVAKALLDGIKARKSAGKSEASRYGRGQTGLPGKFPASAPADPGNPAPG